MFWPAVRSFSVKHKLLNDSPFSKKFSLCMRLYAYMQPNHHEILCSASCVNVQVSLGTLCECAYTVLCRMLRYCVWLWVCVCLSEWVCEWVSPTPLSVISRFSGSEKISLFPINFSFFSPVRPSYAPPLPASSSLSSSSSSFSSWIALHLAFVVKMHT